jgi:diaminopimelate epimerase
MKKVKYCIYNPGGNQTALVFNNHYNLHEKKVINNEILKINKEVEQVGFINKNRYELQMAGGEFCGNATRCAVKYYLPDSYGKQILIKVSGMTEKIITGIDMEGKTWVDVPVKSIEKIPVKNIKIVKLEGITHIVIDEELSKKYLKNQNNLKESAKKIMKNLKVDDMAVGVMFTEIKDNIVKLYPHCMGKKYRYAFL